MSGSDAHALRTRRLTALRACDTVLSGARPASVAEQIDAMRAAGIEDNSSCRAARLTGLTRWKWNPASLAN